jgi:heterodisulfide reductase subunit C
MDVLPSQVIRMAQLGMEEVLEDADHGQSAIWICASCLACTVNCPRGFDLSKMMEAIRLLTLRKNIDHVRPEDISPQECSELPQIAMVGGLRKFTG